MSNENEIDFKALRQVEQKDLRVGDKVIPVPRLLDYVEHVMQVSDNDGDVETEGDYYDPEKYRFLLVHREVPELPTTIGSLIEVDGERYFLRKPEESNAYWCRASQAGWLTLAEMQVVITDAGEFEVIA